MAMILASEFGITVAILNAESSKETEPVSTRQYLNRYPDAGVAEIVVPVKLFTLLVPAGKTDPPPPCR